MCKIRVWQFRDSGGHIFPRIVPKIRPELKLINVDFVLGGQSNGNGIRILERCKFRFWCHSFFNDYACNSQNFACGCEMQSASQLLFLWQTWSRYPISEVSEFQFWQFRDRSCHVFIRILAVSRLHLIDPSSIEHNSACFGDVLPSQFLGLVLKN